MFKILKECLPGKYSSFPPSLESPTPSLLCLEVQTHLPILSGGSGEKVVLFLKHSNFFLPVPELTYKQLPESRIILEDL